MNYPGNSSLAPETQARILETFSQTVDLAQQGRAQEAALGCDFILKMDRQFELAKVLQSRLQGAEGPVDVSDLVAALAPPAPKASEAALPAPPGQAEGEAFVLDLDDAQGLPSLDGLSGLDLSSPTLDSSGLGDPSSPAPQIAPQPPATTGDRIGEFLAEGRAAQERGDHQIAIDAWSRIFLIDIDHAEATSLIEGARKLQAEQERQTDELMHEATTLRDRGRKEEAKAAFERVLEMHPDHLAAKEYLQQLGAPSELEAPAPGFKQPPPETGGETVEGLYEAGLSNLGYALADASVDRGSVAAPATEVAEQAPGRAKTDRSFVRIGAAVFVLLLVAGWLLYSNWGRLFPNTAELPETPLPPSVVQQATSLHLDGKTDAALERLRNVPPEHADYDRAQLLIERWSEDSETGASSTEAGEVGLAEEDRLRWQGLIERARRLYDEREYLEAAKSFQAASKILPLEGVTVDLYNDTKQQLLPIAQQISLFGQREWELLLPTLWRKLGDEPGNRDTRRILANCYFNLGVRELRRGDPKEAREHFNEMVQLRPDPLGERLLLFAESYNQYPDDLLYRIYVGQLEYRQ